ncbi:OmpA family protein [Sungkyunkwania multivorans]|uniref:OmpA family protein n=1 Tax=Sungkyunkwania multivorans TaxID=1173618 RepID=A0ABW3D132_9FLAO
MKNFLLNVALPLAIIVTSLPTLFAQGPVQEFTAEATLSPFGVYAPSASAEIIRELDPNGFKYNVKNLEVNTKYGEHSTSFFRKKLIYASSKKIGAFYAKKDKRTGEGFEDLYCAEIDFYGEALKSQNFSRVLNTRQEHEADATFNRDQSIIFFSRSDEADDYKQKIYRAELVNYQWTNFEKMEFNLDGFTYENPALSLDENTLYFASNMPGTLGGYDIFKVVMQEDGTFSKPINLGKNINTTKDEKYPYIAEDNGALYFSSDGHYNMGGMDIFESKITNDGTYNFPVNMGSSINSVSDDIAFMMDLTATGFFTSDRDGGKGGDDIYHFVRERVTQRLTLRAVEFNTDMPLPNAKVLVKDAYGRVVREALTDKNGYIDLGIIPYNSYTIEASKDGYKDLKTYFESDRGDRHTFEEALQMEQKDAEIVSLADKTIIEVEQIYFDFDKANIKDESTLTLNKIANILNQYPLMNIQIDAHTDARGTDAYNQTLSEKRAKATLDYLISKGIDQNRIIAVGHGESRPVHTCKKGCNETMHKENRRVEFVVLNM